MYCLKSIPPSILHAPMMVVLCLTPMSLWQVLLFPHNPALPGLMLQLSILNFPMHELKITSNNLCKRIGKLFRCTSGSLHLHSHTGGYLTCSILLGNDAACDTWWETPSRFLAKQYKSISAHHSLIKLAWESITFNLQVCLPMTPLSALSFKCDDHLTAIVSVTATVYPFCHPLSISIFVYFCSSDTFYSLLMWKY